MPVPETRRDDTVEVLHGVEVADPYRWLEQPADTPEVRAWIEAQNAWTAEHLAAIPERAEIRARIAHLWNHARRSAPTRKGTAWVQLRNDGLQDQDVLWHTTADPLVEFGTPPLPDDHYWEVLLDPNTLSDDGTTALTGMALTDDGALLAYALSDAGSDWMTWRVRDLGTGQDLGDEVRWAKFAGAAWLPDGAGFVYGGYPPPTEGEEHTAANRGHRLLLHLLGADEDPVVYERPDQPEWGFSPTVTHDGRWLVIHVWHGTATETRVHVAPIEDGMTIGEVRPLLDDGDAAWTFLGVVGERFWFLTDKDAPNGRVVSLHPDDPSALTEVVAEGEHRITGAGADHTSAAFLIGGADQTTPGWLVVHRLVHATSRVSVHDLNGGLLHEVELPGIGTVQTISGGRHDDAIFLTFETFTEPAMVLRHDLETAATTVVHRADLAPAGADLPDLVTEQVFVHHDGETDLDGPVKVPVFLVRRADVAPTGEVPTLLWGYGGFDISVPPVFKVPWRTWVERGGLLAVACLRGGGEYGQRWHHDGYQHNKQHVFDDALAVADWLAGTPGPKAGDADGNPVLLDRAWTSPEHLGIEGRSNGGLLVGACLTQRPHAFGSAVPEVGVMDMLRYHKFTIGWAWASDYLDADDPDGFRTLLAYSPLHNLRDATAYPPTMVTTGDTDDRVVPAHSFKFAAAMQAAHAGDAPVIIRIDTSAGHGAGKPVSKLIDERADVIAFHWHHLTR